MLKKADKPCIKKPRNLSAYSCSNVRSGNLFPKQAFQDPHILQLLLNIYVSEEKFIVH
jgi:hypothetical protein